MTSLDWESQNPMSRKAEDSPQTDDQILVDTPEALNDESHLVNPEHFLPTWFRILAALIVVAGIGACLWVIVRYVIDPDKNASPDQLGLSSILIFLVALLALLAIPLGKLNLRLKKIGPFEFEEIVRTQAKERFEELAEIREKISSLERRPAPQRHIPKFYTRVGFDEVTTTLDRDNEVPFSTQQNDELRMTADANESPQNMESELDSLAPTDELKNLLISFLTKYGRYAFSPSRIKAWGQTRQGFDRLGDYSSSKIRNCLQELVREGLAKTALSQKGNTLYKIDL